MSGRKRRLAVYWGSSCGGCDIALLGIEEKLLELASAFQIVFWPCVMDHKLHDVEQLADGDIDVCLFNGGVRTDDQEAMARLLRSKSRTLIAFGSCAQDGCIPGLANLHDRRQIFEAVYLDSPSTYNPHDRLPQQRSEVAAGTLGLPSFYDTLKTLGQTVEVDYWLPGCPPEADCVRNAVDAILAGTLPEPGTVIGALTTVCDECPRTRSEKKIRSFKRSWQVIPDPESCLLEQGLLCSGIATRSGCGALCPGVNAPCIGCYGPGDGVDDAGARMMTALASVIDSDDPAEIQRIIDEGIPDPVGTFYRFGLAGGLLRRSRPGSTGEGR